MFDDDDSAAQLGFLSAEPTVNWGPSLVLESSRNAPAGTPPLMTQIYGNPLIQDIATYRMIDTSRIPRTNYVEQKPQLDSSFQSTVENAIRRGATVFDSQARPSSSNNKKILIFVAVGVVAAAVLFGMKKKSKRRK